ncbi:hypothetical protein Kfla_0495 [Kribbella flavida DSM 17836]|uniref:Pectate lyase superfamily protein domain-containing protein n=1 Tax=Kribbella flavida (strain DSM 17836 / JCM 10339 / NBRC 14399) TaxID=479435 RepID=D2PVW0_KRIFD|nr:hypothetical protein [Kribbella flavida]ADB29617.1 hypothetical protein Kfla_0495 [Kribbella flavida DSM 17836]
MEAEYRPQLGGDGDSNGALLRDLLRTAEPGHVVLPAGSYPITGGLVLTDHWSLSGSAAGTTLWRAEAEQAPLIHVLGSDVAVSDLLIELPDASPGPHDGAEWTAVTVGRYFYPERPRWIERITLERLVVRRAGRCAANNLTLIGAVRHARFSDLEVHGGGTAFIAHWGAVGAGVSDISGHSLHPHHFEVDGLRVHDAFEGFCLSSVHDVQVRHVRCEGVEIGFRLLPGDNTDRYHENGAASGINQRLLVEDCDIGWCGDLYAVRVAGWGRSEVDGAVTTRGYLWLDLRDVTVRPLPVVVADRPPREGRRPIVVEDAGPVDLGGVSVLS